MVLLFKKRKNNARGLRFQNREHYAAKKFYKPLKTKFRGKKIITIAFRFILLSCGETGSLRTYKANMHSLTTVFN